MGFFDSLVGFAPYAEGVVQRHDQRALASIAQQRQAALDKQNADLAQANVGKLNAEAQALKNKPNPVDAKNQEYQYTVDHPKPVPQKPVPMLKTVDENGRTVYTPQPQAAGLQAPTAPKPAEPMVVTLGKDGRRVYTPRSQAGGMTAPAPIVQPSFSPITLSGDNGQPPVVRPFNTKTGEVGPSIGAAKPTTQGGGGQSLSPDDRNKMLNQARIDNATMKAYETKVMQSGKSPGFAAGAAGIAASAAPTGIIGGIAGLIGNKATGAIDPDYQRYITAQRSYGRIMGNLQSKRYTDHQAEIERSISGLQGNDLNETIQYKQQLRDASLAGDDTPAATPHTGIDLAQPTSAEQRRRVPAQASPAPKAVPKPSAAPKAAQSAAPTQEQALWDEAVKLHGRDVVLHEYGPRPGGGE